VTAAASINVDRDGRTKGNDLSIALVYPSSDDSVQTLYTFNKNQRIGFKPPQSILILATYLRSHGMRNVSCLDAQVERLSPEATALRLAESAPDVIGITAWTDFWYPTWKTLEELRRLLPWAILIVGGPHAAIYPEETLISSKADYVVAGDGEEVLLKMVRAIGEGQPIPELPGVWRRRGDKTVAPSQPLAIVEDITTVPAPDRTLLPYTKYSSILTPRDYETTMVTSRGCPYKCVFCKMDVQRVYARTAEQVVDEFQQIADLGITDVQVYDDTFTWGKARAMDICQGIIDRGIKINWAIRDRVNRASPDLYTLLKKAGCYRVHFGVETGSPEILKNSGKFMTLDHARYAIEVARSVDMTVMTYFMFGFLNETFEDAKMTIAFARELSPDYVSFGVLVPYPGTAIYKEALSRGIIPRDYWRDFALNPEPAYRIPHVVEDVLDRRTLMQMKSRATRQFYFHPKRILRELRSLTSLKELRAKTELGISIFTDGLSPFSVNRY
jgi:radical SAM superfamily enzyme YgiQ (UPF0313 family)